MRLIVIAPTPYRNSRSQKLYYGNPVYLLTTDLRSSLKQPLQNYFDRWQIEVNHREEEDTQGVGQAQLWNARRPSCLDLITVLLKEMQQQPQLLAPLAFTITDRPCFMPLTLEQM